jgi:DNA-binding NarL/FixJ family response regulator
MAMIYKTHNLTNSPFSSYVAQDGSANGFGAGSTTVSASADRASAVIRSGASGGSMKVIVVAGNILFREGLASILASKRGFEVVGHVGTVRAAVDASINLQADLVLMDVELPDGSGFEALREIVARRPGCSVVMLARNDSDDDLFEAFRSGARGYFLKSTPSAQLLKALEALAQGHPVLSRQMVRRIVEEFSRLGHNHRVSAPGLDQLTAREMEVLRHLAAGATNTEIAARLFISENTAKVHVRNIREKLRLGSRSQLVSFARRNGFVGSERTPDFAVEAKPDYARD